MAKTGRNSFQQMLRLPEDLKNLLKAAADANGRSMNAEIVSRLQGIGSEDAGGKVSLYLSRDLLERVDAYAMSIGTISDEVIQQTLEKAFPYVPTVAEYLAGVREAVAEEDAGDPAHIKFLQQAEKFLRDHPELGKRKVDLREQPLSYWP